MGHVMERCDFLDVLEEAAVLGNEVLVDLRNGGQFMDSVREVITEAGEDFAIFENHGRMPLRTIALCRRAHARESSYDAKLGH
jgi:hypothetical protein